jgi:hypothetical protein
MTIDWVLVLAPLAALPVVLLFAFVGCSDLLGIDDRPFEPGNLAIELFLPELTTVINFASLEVKVQYTLDTGQFAFGSSVTLSRDILIKFYITEGSIAIGDVLGVPSNLGDGMVDCACTVTLTGNPMFQPAPAEASISVIPSSGELRWFFLSGDGANFQLQGLLVAG